MTPDRSGPRKLVLAVIDGLVSRVLEEAVDAGKAPALATLIERGVYVDDCAAAFPSVTPVCTSSIMTGVGPDEHGVPGMNWYHRGEERYVDYGSSMPAARAVGFGRQLTDLVYNLNHAHLSPLTPTLFEDCDDAGLRTAGTTFLIYRGRHRHSGASESAIGRLVAATVFRYGVWGPKELFYADIFATRKTGCTSQLGLPGARDEHAGCVGAHLVEHDLCDFMLLSLPDNDSHSHREGPAAQADWVEIADRQIMRLFDAAGGVDAFLDEHAMIVLADHSHDLIDEVVELSGAFERRVLVPDDPRPDAAEIAVCPGARSAMVYVLDPEQRDEMVPEVVESAARVSGVDIVMWLEGDRAVARSGGAELRFAPGGDGDPADARGLRWSLQGDPAVLDSSVRNGALRGGDYPDAFSRIWSSLTCARSGDVLISAEQGHEFRDWGGVSHLGAGSHGSLHRCDSLGPLIWTGCGPAQRTARSQWTLRDVAPMVREHFGL